MNKLINNENISVCSLCGGKCCKQIPGAVFPEQLNDISVESLLQMYKDGYCFDYWEGNPTKDEKYDNVTAYYLRPQTISAIGRMVDPSWGAQCSFLTPTGCKLSFDKRPMECQTLVANHLAPGNCTSDTKGYNKKDAAIKWFPYNDIIEQVLNTRNQN